MSALEHSSKQRQVSPPRTGRGQGGGAWWDQGLPATRTLAVRLRLGPAVLRDPGIVGVRGFELTYSRVVTRQGKLPRSSQKISGRYFT